MFALLRSNLLVLLSFTLYLGALLGVLYITDHENLRYEKAEYCLLNQRQILQVNVEALWGQALRMLSGPRPGMDFQVEAPAIMQARSVLQDMMNDLVHGETPVYEITVLDMYGLKILEASNPRKVWQRRTWENTVFWNFSHPYSIPVMRRNTYDSIGQIKIRFTNPVDDFRIAQITAKHRPRIIGSALFVTFLYGLLFYYGLLPIRNVTAALKEHRDATPAVLRRARTTMEKAYNQVACDALLMRLEERIRSIPERGEKYERFEAQHQLCRALCELFDYKAAWTLSPRQQGERYTLLASFPTQAGSAFDLIGSLRFKELYHLLTAGPTSGSAGPPAMTALTGADQRPLYAMAHWLPPVAPDEPSNILLALKSDRPGQQPPSSFDQSLFKRAAQEAARGLMERQGLRRSMARQRSEANINIARHLGHDLTNIIATSKLDLLAVRNYLASQDQEQGEEGDPMGRIFAESLESLLKNTRFLQEIVNLYRSFGYVRHPQFEWVRVNELVEHMAELFLYSTTARVRIETRPDPDDPQAMLEPRLIRLSLFNLMTNALESINTRNLQSGPQGEDQAPETDCITLETRWLRETNRIEIRVSDTGAGIRSADGDLVPDERLRDILSLGETTKGEAGSEGLGLDWVRTIVEDFHHGRVEPGNLAEGGACFVLSIPIATADHTPSLERPS